MATSTRTGYSAYVGPYAAQINQAAGAAGIDPNLLGALLGHESNNFDPVVVNGRVASSTGDVGIAQINPPSHPDVTHAQASSPAFAIPWAARYLAALIRSAGSVAGGLRAYNTGTSRVTPAGTAYVDQVMAHYRTLTGSAAGGRSGYVNPLPGGYKVGRVDQGVDFQGNPGDSVVAIGPARVDAVKADPGGFGMAVYYTLTGGPNKGQQIYVGHAQPTVAAGQSVDAGQPVATLLKTPLGNATQPGWTEIGFAQNGAPANNGQQFASFWRRIISAVPLPIPGLPIPSIPGLPSWLNPGSVVSGAAGDVAGAIVKPLESFFFDAILYAVFLIGGAALIWIGVRQLFAPRGEQQQDRPELNIFTAPAAGGSFAGRGGGAGAEAGELAEVAPAAALL